VRKKESSFLKKRSKKLLVLEMDAEAGASLRGKSFLVLFFKKEHLSSFLHGWRAILAGFCLGIVAAAALPPFTLVPLLLIAIPGLLALIGSARSWRGAATRGLVFGIGYHLAGLYWVTNAILVMAAEFWWAVPITVPLLATFLALFIAVPCGLARLMPAGWRRVVVLAAAWVIGDIARQFALSGFPWNLLGSVWEMPGLAGDIFIQPAAWFGAHGLTLLTVILAATPALGRRGRIAGLCLFTVWGLAGGLRLWLAVPVPQAPPGLTAVIVQGNVPEAEHRDHGAEPAWADRIFNRYLALTRAGMRQAGPHPAMVIWPETASPYALGQDSGARLAVADAAARALVTLSGTERFAAGPGGATLAHNSLVAVAPDGALAGIYDKSHLVPFGEYFPPYAHFLLGEQGFVPGPGIRTLHLPGLPPLGPLICYEAIFPGQVVDRADRPSMLVNITNDAWFGNSAGPRQHLAAARLRSVEEGLPMLRAANTGISAVIDSKGRILQSLGLGRAGILVASVPGVLPAPPAARWGLADPLAMALTLVILGCIRVNRNLVNV
jgi:apolipoprotein N-acyltransferase